MEIFFSQKIEKLVEFSIEILFHGFLFVCLFVIYLFMKGIKETREFLHGFFLGAFLFIKVQKH